MGFSVAFEQSDSSHDIRTYGESVQSDVFRDTKRNGQS